MLKYLMRYTQMNIDLFLSIVLQQLQELRVERMSDLHFLLQGKGCILHSTLIESCF